jgi:hypothetical protein
MFRNLFAVIASLTISGGVASASTVTETKGLSLEQRIQAAQTKVDSLINVVSDKAQKAESNSKVVQYWSNGYYRPWYNWNNWSNYYRGY